MVYCTALGCSSNSSKGIKMYGFPTNQVQRKKWIARVQRQKFNITKNFNNVKLCEGIHNFVEACINLRCGEWGLHAKHFEPDQFVLSKTKKRRLKSGAIPTIFAHPHPCKESPRPHRRVIEHNYTKRPLSTLKDDGNEFKQKGLHNDDATKNKNGVKEDKVKVLQRTIRETKTKLRSAQMELRKVSQKSKAILKKQAMQKEGLSKVFSPDQIESFSRQSRKGMTWSARTIRQGLRLRFSCGATGYKSLLNEGYPLPSIRTLQRKIQTVEFEPGVLSEVFELLKLKVQGLQEKEKVCCLTLDEMSITPSVELDIASGKLLGDVTLPGHEGIATHGLVFMLAGVTTRWKQTVAYHFSGNSTDGSKYKPIILDILQRAAAIGLHVTSVTSDMGAFNRAMWKSFGLLCGEFANIHSIPHPVAEGRRLHFLPDVPHLIKNLKNALVRGHVITIPQDIVRKNGLPSQTVSVMPVKDLVDFQDESSLKLAPNLNKGSIHPTHFDKMKVSQALNFFSQSASAAITYLVQHEGRPQSHLTTAWFLKTLNHWFDLMSSRRPVMALSRVRADVYKKEVDFLRDIIDLFRRIKIGPKGDWKPVQSGIIMATLSMLELQKELLDAGHLFVLTSRFTQDCLENLFSTVRQKNPVPSPLEFRYALRMITVGQYLKIPNSGSYQDDDNTYLADFLDKHRSTQSEQQPSIPVDSLIHNDRGTQKLSQAESNSLYYLAGYIGSKIEKKRKLCNMCVKSLKQSNKSNQSSSTSLHTLKEFKQNALFKPSDEVFEVIKTVEYIVRSNVSKLMTNTNIIQHLRDVADRSTAHIMIPSCHGVRHEVINRFVKLRVRIEAKKMRQVRNKKGAAEKAHLGSKSQAMRVIVKKLK